jgi:hypothetical protein
MLATSKREYDRNIKMAEQMRLNPSSKTTTPKLTTFPFPFNVEPIIKIDLKKISGSFSMKLPK